MTIEDQILQIYLTYPRHVGKDAALKAIERAARRLVTRKEQPNEEAARRYLWKQATLYARSPAGQKPPKGSDKDFRPHPSTFFNQGRYADDQAEWQKPNGTPPPKGIPNPGAQARVIPESEAYLTWKSMSPEFRKANPWKP
jgi:hypothetical protein